MTSKALISQPVVVHAIHNPGLLIASRALSSQSGIVDIYHNAKIFQTSTTLSTRLRVIHVMIRVLYLEFGPQTGVINKIYNLYHHALG